MKRGHRIGLSGEVGQLNKEASVTSFCISGKDSKEVETDVPKKMELLERNNHVSDVSCRYVAIGNRH